MSIIIGNHNKIKKSTISENNGNDVGINSSQDKKDDYSDKAWPNRHPVITAVLVSFFVGFVLLFSFWKHVIEMIENLIIH